jgi:WD40 repeat protein
MQHDRIHTETYFTHGMLPGSTQKKPNLSYIYIYKHPNKQRKHIQIHASQASLEGHEGEVRAVTMSQSGHMIASGAADKRLILWTRKDDGWNLAADITVNVFLILCASC